MTHERQADLSGARVIYAKSWGSPAYYGDADASAADLASHADWIVGPDDMAVADDPVFMHCLPVRRGVVVADAVLDSSRSIVLDQAAARLDVQKATLCRAMAVSPQTAGVKS